MYHVDIVLYACTFTDSNFDTFTLFSKQNKKNQKINKKQRQIILL